MAPWGCLFPLFDRNGGGLLTAFVGSGVTGGTADAGLSTGASTIEVDHWNHSTKQVQISQEKNLTQQKVGLVISSDETERGLKPEACISR